jgi:hypothetical protein
MRLPSDGRKNLNRSGPIYRLVRGIGGWWTEALHADAQRRSIAVQWAQSENLPSERMCPLCRGVGTVRHVIMRCPSLKDVRERVQDAVELALAHGGGGQAMNDAACAWWADEVERGGVRDPLPSPTLRRWPILSAWLWLAQAPARERRISADDTESSSAGVRRETATDLAYRCLMPVGLGRALLPDTDDSGSGDEEDFATHWQLDAAVEEAAVTNAKRMRLRRAVYITTVVAAGLRRMRWEYAQMIDAWFELRMLSDGDTGGHHPVAPPAEPDVAAQAPSSVSRGKVLNARVNAWAQSPSGQDCIAQLRWLIPTHEVLVARIRAEVGAGSGAGADQIRRSCEPLGIPVRGASGIMWGCGYPSGEEAVSRLQGSCTCAGVVAANANQQIIICGQCGGACPAVAQDISMVRKCRWCKASCNSECWGCGRATRHMLPTLQMTVFYARTACGHGQ